MSPEVFMMDVTHSTNSEGHPLAVSASIDVHMKTFTPIRAFLPTTVPTLLGRDNLVLSDGHSKIYIPFVSVKTELCPHAIHGLCIYHLVTQPLAKLRILEKDKPIVGMS
jgi:hypothetical protein